MDRHTFPKSSELRRSFVDLGDRYVEYAPAWMLRRIDSPETLALGISQHLQTYAARRDEHGRHRPMYKICRGKRWEDYRSWDARARELAAAWNRINWLRTVVGSYPAETFAEFQAWAAPAEVAA